MHIADQDIIDIIAREGRVDVGLLTPDADLAELDIQSLEVVEIIFALEDKFGITVPFNANGPSSEESGIALKTVGDILAMVNRLTAETPQVAAAH